MFARNTLRAAAAFAMIAAGAPIHAAGESKTSALPIVAEHRYRMLARVRPLLFWITKDDVGGAKLSWRGNEAGEFGLDLLIGSDPLRAPRKINRWGYIAEEVRGAEARVVGLMKQSDEQSIAEAEKQLGAEGSGGFKYRAIQGTTTAAEARAGVTSLSVARDLTYRDIDALLGMLSAADAPPQNRVVPLPAGTQPGFLVALHALVTGTAKSPLSYVYYGVFYDLSMKGSTAVKAATIDGKPYTNLAKGDFEIRNRSNGEVTKFQLTYGTQGALAGVPVHAVYQPRWWFEVQLFLDDKTSF